MHARESPLSSGGELVDDREDGSENDKIELWEELIALDESNGLVGEEWCNKECRKLIRDSGGGGGDELCVICSYVLNSRDRCRERCDGGGDKGGSTEAIKADAKHSVWKQWMILGHAFDLEAVESNPKHPVTEGGTGKGDMADQSDHAAT